MRRSEDYPEDFGGVPEYWFIRIHFVSTALLLRGAQHNGREKFSIVRRWAFVMILMIPANRDDFLHYAECSYIALMVKYNFNAWQNYYFSLM